MVFVAAECGNVEALEMLVSAGAKIDAPATTGDADKEAEEDSKAA